MDRKNSDAVSHKNDREMRPIKSSVRSELSVRIDTEPVVSDSDSSITQVTQLSTGENMSFTENDPEPKRKMPTFDSKVWYTHRYFRRYWDHYNLMINWCRKHYQLMSNDFGYHRTRSAPFSYPWYQYQTSADYQQQTRQGRGRGVRTDRFSANVYSQNLQQSRQSHQRKKPLAKRRENVKHQLPKDVILEEVSSADSEVTSASVDSKPCDLEMTTEMIQFFSHTLEHRKQRDEKKKEEKMLEKEDILINIESVSSQQKPWTAEAPKQRPGSQRTTEMKILYGKGAAMIHGMETALQMTFDRNTDLKQPKHWPNMPLKIVFS